MCNICHTDLQIRSDQCASLRNEMSTKTIIIMTIFASMNLLPSLLHRLPHLSSLSISLSLDLSMQIDFFSASIRSAERTKKQNTQRFIDEIEKKYSKRRTLQWIYVLINAYMCEIVAKLLQQREK